MIQYMVAIYLRLSKEDVDVDGRIKKESNSISSQREMIRSFVYAQEDMQIYDIYIDDGYSGKNFDRPEFKRMMADIEAGVVNCVIVKDLSRWGREHIGAGRLIQKTFPALSVRFIALTDGYDSLTADRSMSNVVLPIKNCINDFYLKDISEKVKSSQKIKREQGQFIGAFAVYGYLKDPEDKNKLVVDEYAAGIVRNIFAWKISGMSNLAIAERLDELGILSPLEYKKSKGQNYKSGFQAGAVAKWSAVAVKRILTNEIYTGTMVQGKTEKVNYKVDKVEYKPEAEWVRVTGTHEAIVSSEDFRNVQRFLAIDTRATDGADKAHMFSGLLFCGDCGEPLVRRVNRYKGTDSVNFICSTKNRSEGCSRHNIAEKDLADIILRTLQTQISIFVDVNEQLAYLHKADFDFKEVEAFDKEIKRLKEQQSKYIDLRAGLYEDLKQGVITKEDYKSFGEIYEKQYQETQKALGQQETSIKKLFQKSVETGVKLERMKETLQLSFLDRNTLLTFVERIEVFEEKKIFLKLRNQQEFEKALIVSEYLEHKNHELQEVV